MKKSAITLLLVILTSLSFEAAAQHRHHSNRYRSYERNYSYRNYRRPSLLWALVPRVIIAVPPIVIGRDRNYRRGYQQGRQDRYELERQRRYNERYGREEDYDNMQQQQQRQQPKDSKENNQYERRSNRNYDDNNIEIPENENIDNDNQNDNN
jgi:hypothetical protein